MFDKIEQKPIVGLNPYRPTSSNETYDLVPRILKKRSLIYGHGDSNPARLKDESEISRKKKYLRKNIDPKSFIPQNVIKESRSALRFSDSTKRIKDSDPKSYIPPSPFTKKNIDPKTRAQNDLSIRYQSTRPETHPINWISYPSISTPSILQPNPSLRVLPNYNMWQLGAMYPRQAPLYTSTVPYWVYPASVSYTHLTLPTIYSV